MQISTTWPSLVDDLALADEMFGDRGSGLVSSWLDGQIARVDDPDFARSFSDHIDLSGVGPDGYFHRLIRTAHGDVLAGIRFRGRDITRPFVEVVAHSFDDLSELCDCVRGEWSMFAPPMLRLRGRPGRFGGAQVRIDHSVYVARYRDMSPPTPSVWLEPFDRIDDAESLMAARYRHLAATDTTLARNVFAASHDDLRVWHSAGQLRAVRTPAATVGVLAVVPCSVEWIAGDVVHEEVIAAEHGGHGYASAAQAAWAADAARDPHGLLVGTIDGLNTASRRTAERAGRRRVLDTVFVALVSKC